MYQPKLYLRFNPPLINDTIDIRQLYKILNLIGNEYPTVKWFEGHSPSQYNPFVHTDEDEGIPEEIKSLTIGYWPDKTDVLTYGIWDDNDMGYTNAIDGWSWLKERDVDFDKISDIFDSLNEGKKKEKKEYKPKLNLTFNPPILYSEEFYKIMIAIEALYPKVRWVGGLDEKPTDYNPFEMDYNTDGVVAIMIGSGIDDKTGVGKNELSYETQHYDTNYETKDGWKWYNKKGYVDTHSIFDSLNEDNSENSNDYSPKITYEFEPPIQDEETLKTVIHVLHFKHPGLMWTGNDTPILDYNISNEVFNGGYDFVGSLTIGYWQEQPDRLSWASWVNTEFNYGPIVDGWKLLDDEFGDLDTEGVFSNLNESKRQPKLNLRFEDGISDANELDKVLKVLAIVYPGLKWMGNDPVGTHNIIRNNEEDDFLYDPIYYLTIGYFSHAPNKLTYTSGPDDDIDLADEQQHNYNWVEGWQWVRDNEINYDETTDMFNQLNESYDFLKTTNLIGFIFKAVSTVDHRYWVTRQVINDNGDNLIVNMGYSKSWEDDIGIEDFPKQKSIKKDMVLDFIDSGRWEIVQFPNDNDFNTDDVFNELI